MCVHAAHPALDLRTSHCFCCSPSSSEMEKVCSGSILCNMGVNRLMTDGLSPLQLVPPSHHVKGVTGHSPPLTRTSVSGMWCFPSPGRSKDTRYSLEPY